MASAGRDIVGQRRRTSEQTALRRLAALVGRETSPVEIFGAVTEEARRVLETEAVGLLRFEADESATLIAQSETAWDPPPLGTRFTLDGENVVTRVFHTGRTARVDDWADSTGSVAAMASVLGVRSAVAAPVVVDGRLWGTIIAASSQDAPLPVETEGRIGEFTELIATAMATAEARDARAHLVEEQAALRRVATLVAQQPSPEEIFEVVSVEVARVFGFDADPTSPDIAGVVRFEPGPALVPVGASKLSEAVKLGARFPADELYVSTQVLRTGRSARVGADDLDSVGGETADWFRHYGLLSQVGSPIVVEGRLWGAMTVNSGNDFPADTEERLERFTELVATAIANAESHDALARLAEEQAALRHVATLVARGIGPEAVFRAVAARVGVLFGGDVSAIVRFDDDGMVTVLGDVGGPHDSGKRVRLDEGYVVHRVRETSRSARFDTHDPAAADMPSLVRALGILSAVASPIVVEGKLWGAITAASVEGPLASSAERRLTEFTELVATAVANTQAREQVTALVEEQAALRRVATLVAIEASHDDVFNAIAEEISGVVGEELRLVHFERGRAVVVAGSEGPHSHVLPVGSVVPLGGNNVLSHVFRTGAPVRIDDYSQASGPIAEAVRQTGLQSAAATPIIVEGRPWGAILVAAFGAEAVPLDTERRLAEFTELMATAISNAQARGELSRLLDEQAGLRRVATLVADQAEPSVIFASVAEEVAQAVAGERCAIGRFEDNDALTVIAYWSHEEQKVPVGATFDLGNDEVVAAIRDSGRLLRIDDHEAFSGPLMDYARTLGSLPKSTIAAPVFVGGRMWGVIFTSTMADVLPEGIESRIVDFAELVATAIANADSREALEGLVQQQAALRRVATLVAEGAQPSDIFEAVSEEVEAVLHLDAAPTDAATIVRFDPGPECVLVGASKPIEESPLGSRWEPHDAFASTRVLRTKKSARVEQDDLSMEGSEAEKMRRQGYLSQVASPIVVEGRLWGAMTASSMEQLPLDTETRLEEFTELIGTAIANAEGKFALAASRRRIVAASDETRRQIERDLHDGTQQRLVSLGLALRAAEATVPPGRDDLRVQLSGVATGLVAAVEDLQEISRGIHPAILAKGGLAAALQALAHRSSIPVDLDITAEVRLEEPIEVAAYFVASEALANAAKHSEASRIDVLLEQRDSSLVLSIADDGVGGADLSRGSGLIGLSDRVEALGGSIRVSSPPGDGTQIRAELPLELELPQPA